MYMLQLTIHLSSLTLLTQASDEDSSLMLNEPIQIVHHHYHQSSRLVSLLPLPLPLSINLRRERILKPQRDTINRPDQHRQNHARRLSKPQRRAQKAQSATVVHRRTAHIEREARDHLIHQNPKIVAQIRSRNAQRPHAAQHKRVATEEESDCEALGERGQEERVGRLGAQGALVDEVAGDSEGEDCDGQGVAAAVGVVAG